MRLILDTVEPGASGPSTPSALSSQISTQYSLQTKCLLRGTKGVSPLLLFKETIHSHG
jgi:hypothetical protein